MLDVTRLVQYFIKPPHANRLPGRIVREWDWRERRVSVAAATHIDLLYGDRQIDVVK